MEIISFIQEKPKSRPAFGRITLPKTRTKNLTYNLYTPELKKFTAQKVRNDISVKSLLRNLGHALTLTADFISSNIKTISITLLISFALISLAFAGFKIKTHFVNFTGPLPLETGHCLDLENLDKLMEEFALQTQEMVDERGNLLEVENAVVQSFTRPVTYQNYKVRSGDTISGIASKFGLRNISTLISVNDIGNVRQLAAGQKLRIPSIDGIVYTVKSGDSLSSIVTKYGCKLNELLDVNELTSETLSKGQVLFIPGAAMDAASLRNAMGELFRIPIAAKFRWTSPYGARIDPIAGVKSFHTATDLACPTGTPILAAMSGRVTSTGINRVYGNYVIIDHGNGYQTLYAHMSKIIASKGQWVSQGTRIGLVGSTGYSTGPHLHFTVYKNGKLVDPMSVLK